MSLSPDWTTDFQTDLPSDHPIMVQSFSEELGPKHIPKIKTNFSTPMGCFPPEKNPFYPKRKDSPNMTSQQFFVPWPTWDRNRSTSPADERDFQSHPKKYHVCHDSWISKREKWCQQSTRLREKWSLLCNFRSIQYLSRTPIESKGPRRRCLCLHLQLSSFWLTKTNKSHCSRCPLWLGEAAGLLSSMAPSTRPSNVAIQ